MLNKKWTILPKDENLIQDLSCELTVSKIASQLLINRGIRNINEAHQFLFPSLLNLSSPFKMKDMEKAVTIILKKIKEGANIFIYGDYDVDGITAVSVLYKVLSYHYENINFYIPHRIDEGYGLNCSALKKIKDQKGNLVITVDCGIQSNEEVDFAKSIGLDIIITDHHLPGEVIPKADAVINPQQADCEYPFHELAGVGVAFRLAQSIHQTISPYKILPDEEELLASVALGTIADMVPLLGENRILVKYGLEAINKTSSPGLKSLKEISGLADKKIDTDHVGFLLAPRLNATGRLSNANLSLELLLTKDRDKAYEIALDLNTINETRQKILGETLLQAVSLVEKHIDLQNEKIIVLAWQGWHAGIIGLVASKLAEKYSRPAIVIALDGEKGKGSGRSVKNLDLFKTVSYCKHLLHNAGGHHQAVGFNIMKENIKEFRKGMNSILMNLVTWDDLSPEINIDLILKPEEINMDLVQEIDKIMPFGIGNPKPVFALKKIFLKSEPKILKNKHIKFKVGTDNIVLDAIGFNKSDKISALDKKTIDIAFNLEINEWCGKKTVNMQIKELGNDKI